MSNPWLEVHVDSAATIPAIERLLEVSLEKAELREAPPGEYVPGRMGGIQVSYKGRIPYYGEYDRDWKFRVILDNAGKWDEIRLVLAMKLCQWLLGEFPGYYLGRLDTGAVLFYGNQEEMSIDDRARALCEASRAFDSYPFEGRRQFRPLRPV